ncbi:RCC1/BLIP-II [Wolfiporia cocos MD-104 SS10]|uniref:RCC1/BLIP-II n=1 Tax=Wolfiporia cocos (strain MD-104) TaxID=742152 RepID=A0A2H3J8S7_WOLCO|nr:RCC1/BLIP-II [Wolfiporia cocos MD-104 SS10]
MLRSTGRALHKVSRGYGSHTANRLHTQASRVRNTGYVLIGASAAVAATAGTLWYSSNLLIHNDAPPAEMDRAGKKQKQPANALSSDQDTLNTLVWGSNKNHVLDLDGQTPESIRTPAAAAWLEDVALRDLALHERHAACVDARGDVYQWGDGFSGRPGSSSSGKPSLTLRGKNIVRVQATPARVFALSASGRIYVLSSAAAEQTLPPGTPTPASSPWWGTGWLWGEEEQVDFAEIVPSAKLGWGEKFVAIAAGTDHLLALTSAGRTFAHPVNLSANAYGQLGFRRCDVPAPASPAHPHFPHGHRRIPLDLVPKSVKDPYAKATPAIRRSSSSDGGNGEEREKEQEQNLDDRSIRFSDKLFEVPALKGVKVEGIAAGARTSFVRTDKGRVLGWGANEFGQIGLGGNVALDTISVPTEVILWRTTPAAMRTTCLDVFAGGDLTLFTVERADGTAMPYVDVLACGNGQYGGLGNAQFSNAQGAPVKARNVSGLLEYSEKHNNLQPVMPYDISVSPTGHVLLTLDTLARGGPGAAGRDIVAWGANYAYELGNGRRGSVATPTVMLDADGQRFMLARRNASAVKDLQGKVWKKNVEVEQRAVAGWGGSVVYWKICS